MRTYSIKFKITCWYTAIMIVIFGVILGGIFAASEYYGESCVKAELQDEMKDLEEELLNVSEPFSISDLLTFYDDGVMLSIYGEDFSLIYGVLPDGFPEQTAFEENSMRKIRAAEEQQGHWFLSDRKITIGDGTVVWIRGIYSYSGIVWMSERITSLLIWVFPSLILIMAFVGYRMIQRSLRPLQAMMQTANQVIASGDLTTQLPLPKTRDEFYDLTVTFNRMFEVLRENSCRERQFSSDAAHELRTPASVLLSHCEYCLEELDVSGEVKEELQLIRNKAMQMSELVSDLLILSRAENQKLQPNLESVDLSMLAESVSEEMEEKAAVRGIRISVVNKLKKSQVMTDMGLLVRVFMNLINNAITYGKENGFVQIQMYEEAGGICISFQDNGIGIPKESLDKIWDRFYQVDPSHADPGNFGLGLSMVKQIVECQGGWIRAESVVGEGTTFTVWLPQGEDCAGFSLTETGNGIII